MIGDRPGVALSAFVLLAMATGAGMAAETAVDIIADTIRIAGHPCTKALSAERDPALSRPDLAVWVIRCENATYRVQLVPDMAPRVERLAGP